MQIIKKYLSLLLCLLPICLYAQKPQNSNYTPTSSWPYLYEEFQQGWITFIGGSKLEYDKINLCLGNGRIHYVKNDIIMEALPNTIALLKIGNDSFVYASGLMVKILQNTHTSAVVEKTVIDYEAMNKADIGYGKSSIASTQNMNLQALNIETNADKSLDDIVAKRNAGTELTLSTIKGIFYKGNFVPASRIDILNIPDIDKNAVKDFIKKEKINFRKTEDLAKLADFLTK